MKYLIALEKITLERCYFLVNQGYKLDFKYNHILPYVDYIKERGVILSFLFFNSIPYYNKKVH